MAARCENIMLFWGSETWLLIGNTWTRLYGKRFKKPGKGTEPYNIEYSRPIPLRGKAAELPMLCAPDAQSVANCRAGHATDFLGDRIVCVCSCATIHWSPPLFFEMYKDFPVREAIFSLRFRPYFRHELNGLNNSIVIVGGLLGVTTNEMTVKSKWVKWTFVPLCCPLHKQTFFTHNPCGAKKAKIQYGCLTVCGDCGVEIILN